MTATSNVERLKRRLQQRAAVARRRTEVVARTTDAVQARKAAASQARAAVAETVAELRAAGVTWAEIGRLLGVSRQAASKAFGHNPAGEGTTRP